MINVQYLIFICKAWDERPQTGNGKEIFKQSVIMTIVAINNICLNYFNSFPNYLVGVRYHRPILIIQVGD